MQVGNKGNIEAIFTDLLELMRYTVHSARPTEEEASVIAKRVLSAFSQRWREHEPRFVEYFNSQWQAKIGNIIHTKHLRKKMQEQKMS